MKRLILLTAAVGLALSGVAKAQGVNDLFAGKLVDPKVGQWAWYDISDTSGGKKYTIRQAVVGEEPVDGKKGYWVEIELVPAAGFKTVYKMLLTGPANDPKNIHKILAKQGNDPVETVSVEKAFGTEPAKAEPNRKQLGSEDIKTAGGSVRADHYSVDSDAGPIDMWINEAVPPTGIVRVKSAHGQMALRNYGAGGKDGASAITADAASSQPKVSVSVGKDAAPPADKPAKKGKSK